MVEASALRREARLDEENSLVITPVSPEIPGVTRKPLQVVSKDVSAGGLRIRVPVFIPLKCRMKVDITLAKPRKHLTAFAQARWVRPVKNMDMYDVGIEFEARSPDLIAIIRAYVDGKL